MNKKRIILFLFVIILGVFLRVYNFSDWLHFELDQSRDIRVVELAETEGIGSLPLLGPRAGGTSLRLGPAFYYSQYLSARIFGATPAAVAYPVLLSGILSLPLFYLLSRRYFGKNISLALVLLYSISLYLIMYSRFAWNPNPLPFFILLVLYSLLKVTDRENRKKEWWFLALVFSISVVTQLHFLAFLAVPTIAVVYLIIKRPRVKLWGWIGAVGIILLFYAPVIINDLKTGGANAGEFIKAITKKSDNEAHNIVEKGIRNWAQHSVGYFMILTGSEKAELPKVVITRTRPFLAVKCDVDCEKNSPWGFVALIFYSLGIFLLLKNYFQERDRPRKDFLLLALIWLGISFALLLPIAYDISPRFFLLTAPAPFIFLGFILELIRKKSQEKKIRFIMVITVILVATNLFYVAKRFGEYERAPREAFAIEPDRILKEKHRITFLQEKLIADYIYEKGKDNGNPFYVHCEAQYDRAIKYLLKQYDPRIADVKKGGAYRKGNHFLVYASASGIERDLDKYRKTYDITGEKQFGTLVVFHLLPKEEGIIANDEDFIEPVGNTGNAKMPKRYMWKEIFGSETSSDEDEEIEEDADAI